MPIVKKDFGKAHKESHADSQGRTLYKFFRKPRLVCVCWSAIIARKWNDGEFSFIQMNSFYTAIQEIVEHRIGKSWTQRLSETWGRVGGETGTSF